MTVVSITIRNRDDDVKTRLWMRAADNVRSMEGNTWLILRDTVERKRTSQNLTSILHASSSMLQLLPHDFFVLLPFIERHLIVPSTGVEEGL